MPLLVSGSNIINFGEAVYKQSPDGTANRLYHSLANVAYSMLRQFVYKWWIYGQRVALANVRASRVTAVEELRALLR